MYQATFTVYMQHGVFQNPFRHFQTFSKNNLIYSFYFSVARCTDLNNRNIRILFTKQCYKMIIML